MFIGYGCHSPGHRSRRGLSPMELLVPLVSRGSSRTAAGYPSQSVFCGGEHGRTAVVSPQRLARCARTACPASNGDPRGTATRSGRGNRADGRRARPYGRDRASPRSQAAPALRHGVRDPRPGRRLSDPAGDSRIRGGEGDHDGPRVRDLALLSGRWIQRFDRREFCGAGRPPTLCPGGYPGTHGRVDRPRSGDRGLLRLRTRLW